MSRIKRIDPEDRDVWLQRAAFTRRNRYRGSDQLVHRTDFFDIVLACQDEVMRTVHIVDKVSPQFALTCLACLGYSDEAVADECST